MPKFQNTIYSENPMNEEKYFNASRLKFARKRRGYSIKALSNSVNITTRTYSDYENGHSTPNPGIVKDISSALNFPVDFFYKDDISPISIDCVSFRSLARMSASVRDMAVHAGQIALEFSSFFESKFELPKVNLPDLRDSEPETAAAFIRNEWSIGEKSIRNIVHLLEAMGVRVFSLDENTLDMDAFSFWMNNKPFIFLNTNKSVEHGRFDSAHELGHLLLHKHGSPAGKEAETEANRFASAFLMPEGSVKASLDGYPTLNRIISLKYIWLVSAAALVRRLKDLSILTEWQYRSLTIEMSKRGYLRNEPNPIKQRETSQLLPMIFKALKEDGITKRNIAEKLSVNIFDIDALMFNLAIFQVIDGNKPERKNNISNANHLRQVK